MVGKRGSLLPFPRSRMITLAFCFSGSPSRLGDRKRRRFGGSVIALGHGRARVGRGALDVRLFGARLERFGDRAGARVHVPHCIRDLSLARDLAEPFCDRCACGSARRTP
jgi:hypothetical protein